MPARTLLAACECALVEVNPLVLKALENVPEEVTSKYYGCGSAFPINVEARVVLDLGSGSGRDCYVVAQFVGPEGRVIGTFQRHSDWITTEYLIFFLRRRYDR